MSSRRISAEEVEAIEAKTANRLDKRDTPRRLGTEHSIALDGLAIVVNEGNPVNRMSFSELRDVFSLKVTDWKDVKEWKSGSGNAAGLAVAPVRRREPSGTLDFFIQRIRPDAKALQDKAVESYVSNDEVAAAVAQLPGGIGFIGQSYPLAKGVKRLQIYDDSPEGGEMKPDQATFPDPAAVQTGRYPLSRIVYFYTPNTLQKEAEQFIRYTLSTEGQDLLASKGGLVKIEGTRLQLEQVHSSDDLPAAPPGSGSSDKRNRKTILRLHGSNTIGSECAVSLAYNFLLEHRGKSKKPAPIEDLTTELVTPEGEKALAHEVMCDLDGDGTWETIEIRPTGSSDAFRGLLNGWCDIGMSSRRISDAEVRDLQEVAGDLSSPGGQFALGIDALAVITHPKNPVQKLTLDQVAHLFLGNLPDWSKVGGAAGPINIYSRPERSGTYRSFCDAVLQGRSVSGDARRHAENSAVAEAVAQDSQGIGFVPAFAVGDARALSIGHSAEGEFYAPAFQDIRSARYPATLCRFIYLYVPEEVPNAFTAESRINWPVAREFVKMTQSWRGQLIVEASGFVSEVNFTDSEGVLKRRKDETAFAYVERLATVQEQIQRGKLALKPQLQDGELCTRLLFEANQSGVSAESRNTLELKLPAWLNLYPSATTKAFIAEGWSDDLGNDAQAVEISGKRAAAVAQVVKDTLNLKVESVGMGVSHYPPNDGEANKHMNRRVVLKLAPN